MKLTMAKQLKTRKVVYPSNEFQVESIDENSSPEKTKKRSKNEVAETNGSSGSKKLKASTHGTKKLSKKLKDLVPVMEETNGFAESKKLKSLKKPKELVRELVESDDEDKPMKKNKSKSKDADGKTKKVVKEHKKSLVEEGNDSSESKKVKLSKKLKEFVAELEDSDQGDKPRKKNKSKSSKSKDVNGKAKKLMEDFDESMEEENDSSENKKMKSSKKSKELVEEFDDSDQDDKPRKKDKSKSSKSKDVTGKTKKVVEDHKASLSNLKNIDPEFYKFLKENDRKLLNFEADYEAEEKNESDDEHDEPVSEDEEESIHKPNEVLEAASDESDFEEDNTEEEDTVSTTGGSITLKLLKQWQAELSDDKVKAETIKNVILAVNSALLSVSGENVDGAVFKVEGAGVFNGVLQLCVLHLHPAVLRFLGLTNRSSIKPHKCRKWKKVRTSLRGYFTDLTKLLEHISSANILIVLLKHLHQISPMIASFSNMTKPILKRLVALWSTSDETVRVLAFLCILKITRGLPTSFLNVILKVMYLSYVRNSKFVSPGTLPGINFMRRSLTEMFALDLNVSYKHVFLYIRQLAIHLRNALTLKKKDSYQSVYNWQFINSMRLWAELLSATNNKTQLQPLIYPLVSIVTGVIKLIPTAQFFPLRFHCIQILIQLSKETRNFIPVLPFILEVLNSNTFNKKHSKVSMKPLSFTCILRLNKQQMLENGFRDEVVQNIFDLTLEYMANESYSLSYPELAVPCIINLKQYIKKRCKNSNYSRKLKQLVEKLEENSKFVEKEREKINFTLKDAQLITAWETTLKNKGTPLLTYYNNWVKTNFTKKKRQAIQSDDINDYDIPTLKRKLPGTEKVTKEGPVELFPSDDEDEKLDVEKQPRAKKMKKEKKPAVTEVTEIEEDDDFNDDGVDIVKDLDLDDW
ncbi:Nucleolar complex protein 2 like [Pseudolycoriella hygida]|uniref:Nucleolar complex protein 2 like n=1 Tax=Pseudolycoriella hygida TaxID=35572 RepID=A0A9Q0RV66_9DIPT|nr:Nucleolar complex protein 2 like [Pseudolycoriella hygida]